MIVAGRHEREVALEQFDGLPVGVHLHRQRGAVAHFVGVAAVEDEQAVDRRGRAREVVLREIRGLQLRGLVREDLFRRERAEVMFAQQHAAAERLVEDFLQLDHR